MQRKFLKVLIISLLALSSFACSKTQKTDKEQNIINLHDHLYLAEADRNSTIEDLEKLRFRKFNGKGLGNIQKVIDKDTEYVWLMVVFTVPEELRQKTLGLFISYLHFADKVWLNNSYIGGYGQFPPNEKSALWSTHFYSLSEKLLNPVGRNILLIKVYCRGRTGISDNILLGENDKIEEINRFYTFFQSVIYIFAVGGMLFTALLFFLIFIWRKKEHEYLTFSLLCLSTMLLATPFFSSSLPLSYPNNVPFLPFIKMTLCIGLYFTVFFLSTLTFDFIKRHESKLSKIIRYSILAFCTLVTFFAPNYKFLTEICPLMLTLSVIQLLSGFVFVLTRKLTKEEKQNLRTFTFVLIPLAVSIPIDFFIKMTLQKIDFPYVTLFGWQMSLLCFIIILSTRYNKAVSQNEYLNANLLLEIDRQTRELHEKNMELEHQITRSQIDLEMASLVQKKFFPYPPKKLRGWDIAVSYSPLDKVSGDMYDYYTKDDILNGFSLFDVSGHGIAASLVTMLAKNIIYQAFLRNMVKNETVSRTLYEINDEIIEAKGEVENYLTGLMFRFKPFDENDVCKVEMANAGHPNPLFYSASDGICTEIKPAESSNHHGAIGLDFITVSFPQISFKMAENDILLFYTDGLTESRNKENDMFGKERVKNIIRSSCSKDAESIMEDIICAFNEFTRDVKRDDDITVIVMKRESSNNFVEELMEL